MNWREIARLWWKQQRDFLPDLKAQAKRYEKIEDAAGLPERVLKESKPVFVLSTGRAGTQYLTELFEGLEGFSSVHEPQPELLYTSRWAYEHKSQPDLLEAAFLSARYELIRNSFLEGKRYLETNNRLCFLAEGILQAFPNALFIHLIRHPEAFIRSGLQRKWYTNEHLTDEGRIQPNSSLGIESQEDKIAWLWNETNSQIAEFGKKAGSERFLEILSEDLFKDLKVNRQLFEFIHEKYPGDSLIQTVQSRPKNTSKKNPSTQQLKGTWKEYVPFALEKNYQL